MALITQTDIEAKLGRSLSADEIQTFNLLNLSIQAYVERMIGSSVEDVAPSTRYYDGGVMNMSINPCTDITEVKYVDENQATEYAFLENEVTKEPVNRTLKTMIRNRYIQFNTGFNNVAVTAKFSIYGDENMRNIVKSALIDMIAEGVENKEDILSETIEGYSINYDKMSSTKSVDALKMLFYGVI